MHFVIEEEHQACKWIDSYTSHLKVFLIFIQTFLTIYASKHNQQIENRTRTWSREVREVLSKKYVFIKPDLNKNLFSKYCADCVTAWYYVMYLWTYRIVSLAPTKTTWHFISKLAEWFSMKYFVLILIFFCVYWFYELDIIIDDH